MKKYLIPESGKFYKANLHAHSTVSDGKQTPEEIKALFSSLGYSIVAYTDHGVFIPHNDLTDESFLALNGVELCVGHIDPANVDWRQQKVCDIGMIALDADIVNQPVWHRQKYKGCGVTDETRALAKFDESLPDYERVYSPEGISEMMRMGREKGFFVIHNHPTGSMELYPDYIGYQNLHAMEMYNYDSIREGILEYNALKYEDCLRAGKRIYCVYTDDSHFADASGFGWVMIKAERLDYPTIAKALLEGNFYSSSGPEITSLWYEDKKVHITFPKAAKVIFYTDTGRRAMLMAPGGDPTAWGEAEFSLVGFEKWVRVTVYDERGNTADTNGYFLDELDECFQR